MIAEQPTKAGIPSPVRSRINFLAHHLVALEEARLRAVLPVQVQDAADDGASFEVLNELVDKLRDGPTPIFDGLASRARICCGAKP